jgi:hypothetical protein
MPVTACLASPRPASRQLIDGSRDLFAEAITILDFNGVHGAPSPKAACVCFGRAETIALFIVSTITADTRFYGAITPKFKVR